MVIIGVSHGHDAGACLYIDGEIVVCISEERLTRSKRNTEYVLIIPPQKSIDYCLNYAGLSGDDVDYFIFNVTQFRPDLYYFLKYYYNTPNEKIKYVSHHLAHAACSVFTSKFEDCAVVITDSLGEDVIPSRHGWKFFEENGYDLVLPEEKGYVFSEGWSLYYFNGNNFIDLEKKWVKTNLLNHTQKDECTIGYLYSEGASQIVGGDSLSNSGTLMGIASYSDKEWVSQQERNHYVINDNLYIKPELFFPDVDQESPFEVRANVGGLYQREQEECCQFLVDKSKRLSNSNNITVGGGSFLNCNTNTNIIKSDLFNDSHFFASCDDSGIPLGCALYGGFIFDKPIRQDFFSPYLGREYSRDEILKSIDEIPDLDFKEFYDYNELTDFISDLLVENKTIGWFQGRSEIGPRALGNRSIIANPKESWMRDYINSDIKNRQWFRPFAPSVLYEHQHEIFEMDYFSPYMLLTSGVKEEWKDKIPSVTHIDGTSRYQSVTRETNQRYYDLISKFNEKTGIPLVLNTSFNGPDEPIVETPKDAIKTFFDIGLDILVIGDFVIKKNYVSLSYDYERMD